MAHLTTEKEPKANKNRQWDRNEVASNLIQFEKVRSRTSQRQAAKKLGVPRTTLRSWLARKDSLDASPVVAAFFEHPDGLAFLHRLVIAAQFVMSLHSNGSIRMLCLFLKLSGLNSFVASSYGAQQKNCNHHGTGGGCVWSKGTGSSGTDHEEKEDYGL